MKSATRETAAFYDREAARYDGMRWQSPVGRYIAQAQQEIVFDACDFGGKRVIELGPGSGRFTASLARRAAGVTAVDISAEMLKTTAERLTAMGLRGRVRLVSASAAALPFADGEFEAGLSVNMFSHLEPFALAVQEIGRVLAPGGVLVANFPNLLSGALPIGAAVNLTGRGVFRKVYTHWYSWGEIARAYSAAGLHVERVIGHFYLPRRVKTGAAVPGLRLLDRGLRNSVLRRLAPVIFIVARKM